MDKFTPIDATAEIRAEVDGMECGAGMTFGEVRAYIAGGVAYCLPDHGAQEWRREAPSLLAERIADHITAGIAPVIANGSVSSAVAIMRDMVADDGWLARNGLQRVSADGSPDVAALVAKLPRGEWGSDELGTLANWLIDAGYDIGQDD